MKKVIIATAAAAVVLTGCSPISTIGSAAKSSSGSKSTSVRAASPTLEAEPADPYSSTGTWLVPDEIAPGTYRVSLQPGESNGYGAVCGDYECDPFGQPGIISNDNYYGPGIMVVPQSAVSVELKRIALTPMIGQRG